MQLKRAVVCFVTVSGIAMMSVIGQETQTGKSETEAGTSRESNEDLKDRNQALRDRYGIGAAEASPGQSEPATKTGYEMDPLLMERYGLPPRGGAAASGRDETASGPYEMDPLLAERYGLTPPGGASRTGQGAQPPTDLRLPTGGRRAGTAAPGLAAGILDGEAGGDLNQAIQAYRGVIEDFDARRGDAAQAVFRLGEAYRRLGMAADARLQYARILREFPDQAELARMSLDRISEPIREFQTGSYAALPPTSAIPTTSESLKTQLELLQQELELMEREIRAAERQLDAGVASFSEVSGLKREALGLKRQIAILQGQIDSAHSQDGEEGAEVSVQPSISFRNVLWYKSLVERHRDIVQREAELNTRYTGEHPNVVQIRRERAELEAQMNELQGENPGIESRMKALQAKGPAIEELASTPDHVQRANRATLSAALSREQVMLMNRENEKKRELLDLQAKLKGIESADPALIPVKYIDDPRYHKLKSEFETAFLTPGGKQKEAHDVIQRWVEKIYLPELEAEIRGTQREIAELEAKRMELRQQVNDLQRKGTF